FGWEGEILALQADSGAGDEFHVRDLTSGRERLAISAQDIEIRAKPVFSQDGLSVAWVEGNYVSVADVKSGQRVRQLPHDELLVSGAEDELLRLSPDGKRLALKNGAGQITVWDLPGGERLSSFPARGDREGHAEPIRDLAFSPDGKRLATASPDTTIK